MFPNRRVQLSLYQHILCIKAFHCRLCATSHALPRKIRDFCLCLFVISSYAFIYTYKQEHKSFHIFFSVHLLPSIHGFSAFSSTGLRMWIPYYAIICSNQCMHWIYSVVNVCSSERCMFPYVWPVLNKMFTLFLPIRVQIWGTTHDCTSGKREEKSVVYISYANGKGPVRLRFLCVTFFFVYAYCI